MSFDLLTAAGLNTPDAMNLASRLPQGQAHVSTIMRLIRPLARQAGFCLDGQLDRTGHWLAIELTFNGARAEGCLDVTADPVLLAIVQHDPAERLAFAALLLDELIVALQQLQLGTVQLCAVRPWQAPPPEPLGPCLYILNRAVQAPLPFLLTHAEPSILAALLAATPAYQPAAAWAHQVMLPIRPCLAQHRYQTDRLASLRPGDVLLAPIVAHDHCYQLSLHCGAYGCRQWQANGRADGQLIHLESTPHMSSETPSSAPVTAVSQVEIPVQLELDPLVLPFSQLQELTPGQILELPCAVEEATVRLIVYGQEIGSGRLIAVGEHMGVQLAGISGGIHGDD